MSACRVESAGSTPTTPQTPVCELEDFYPLLTMAEYQQGESSPEGDVYSQLAQKERDLILAAELGKALLEKNQELAAKNEQLVEEYSQKIEELEQEKYELHLRLEKMEVEYENTVKELQYDISLLRQDLQSSKEHSMVGDKERSQAIRELTQQNERLAEQVRQSALREDELESEVCSLREQIASRRTSMHEHVNLLEMMREEIHLLSERKLELEHKISLLTEERASHACGLEEAQERIMMLEKQKQDKEIQLHKQGRELLELQEANAILQVQIEHLSQKHSSLNSTGQSQTLFSELSQISEFDSSSARLENLDEVSVGQWQGSVSAEMLDEDDFECDDDEFNMAVMASSSMSTESSFLSEFQHATERQMEEGDKELRSEVIHVYKNLKKMVRAIKGESTASNDSSDEENASKGDKSGQLSGVLSELQQLMQEMMLPPKKDGAAAGATSGSSFSMDSMEKCINELQNELDATQHQLQHVQNEMHLRDAQLDEKNFEFAAMAQKLREQQENLLQLQKERDTLQDGILGEVSKDDVLLQTRKDRDQAMQRGHQLEMELAKAKIDLMTLNSQLLGAIHQKVCLSEELDQWQVDMESLLDYQMGQRIKQEKDREKVEEALQDQVKKSKSTSSFFALKKT